MNSNLYFHIYLDNLIQLYLMAKRPLKKGEIQSRNACLAFVSIFFLVIVGANLIVASEFGIYLQFGAPSHDSPLGCTQDDFLQCTTREGKCTKEQDKCVYPESNDDCSFIMFTDQLSNNQRKNLKSLYTNETILIEKTRILEQYCSTEMVHLYTIMTDDLIVMTAVFEVFLAAALFGLFFSEIIRISHDLAYN